MKLRFYIAKKLMELSKYLSGTAMFTVHVVSVDQENVYRVWNVKSIINSFRGDLRDPNLMLRFATVTGIDNVLPTTQEVEDAVWLAAYNQGQLKRECYP